MSIVTYPLNGITYDADDVQTYLCTRTSGVYSSEDCFDIAITDDMEVTIGAGIAWIKNADFAGKSVCMDESAAFTISLGAGSYERIDRIVLKFDTEANETTLEVLEGTPSAEPVAPDIEQDETIYELCLYEISVPAGTTELTTSLITDTRADESLCGLMRDGVTTIPTATLQAAAYELIEKLKDDIDDVEAGSAYMLASLYDSKGGAKQVAFMDEVNSVLEIALDVDSWEEDEDAGTWTQTVESEDIAESDNPLLVSVLEDGASASTQKAYNKMYAIVSAGTAVTADGSVTFTVYKEPTSGIDVGLRLLTYIG